MSSPKQKPHTPNMRPCERPCVQHEKEHIVVQVRAVRPPHETDLNPPTTHPAVDWSVACARSSTAATKLSFPNIWEGLIRMRVEKCRTAALLWDPL